MCRAHADARYTYHPAARTRSCQRLHDMLRTTRICTGRSAAAGAAHPLRGPLLAPHAVPRDSPALAYY
jgi:hypothetical protein